MQTFLPYSDFRRSAEALDPARLGKQRVETLQILRALELFDYGWGNHPAVTMWRGHTPALVSYGLAFVDVWLREGRADTVIGDPAGAPAESAADVPGAGGRLGNDTPADDTPRVVRPVEFRCVHAPKVMRHSSNPISNVGDAICRMPGHNVFVRVRTVVLMIANS